MKNDFVENCIHAISVIFIIIAIIFALIIFGSLLSPEDNFHRIVIYICCAVVCGISSAVFAWMKTVSVFLRSIHDTLKAANQIKENAKNETEK